MTQQTTLQVAGGHIGENAYGELFHLGEDGQLYPIICMHGGSMWLCRACKDKFMAESRAVGETAKSEEGR